MNYAEIFENAEDQEKGRELELKDPFTGEPTGMKMTIVGPDSTTAHKADLAFADELAELADDDGRVSAENREKARLNALAHRIIRWEVAEDGKPITFNTKNLLTLLRVRWIEEQVDAFAGDRRNFKPEV